MALIELLIDKQMDEHPSSVQAIIEGTVLPLANLSAVLADSSKSVLHLEPSSYYAGCFAALTLNDLKQLSSPQSSLGISNLSILISQDVVPSRNITIDLFPQLIMATSPIVDDIVAKNVQHYLEFQGLDKMHLWQNGQHRPIPCSKEDIFMDTSLSLIQKRKTMKAMTSLTELSDCDQDITLAAKLAELGLDQGQIEMFMYAICFCPDKASMEQCKSFILFSS